MADAETFIKDFHTKNQTSLDRHLVTLRASIAKENLDVGDFIRLAMKDAIESAEVGALWFVDSAGSARSCRCQIPLRPYRRPAAVGRVLLFRPAG